MSRNSRRRSRLLNRGRLCHWCGVEVTYIHAREWARGAMPANFATVDHLDDRLSCPNRADRAPAPEERTVLECLACNLRRNREQQARLAKDGFRPGG
jgi:hypothetical protein